MNELHTHTHKKNSSRFIVLFVISVLVTRYRFTYKNVLTPFYAYFNLKNISRFYFYFIPRLTTFFYLYKAIKKNVRRVERNTHIKRK